MNSRLLLVLVRPVPLSEDCMSVLSQQQSRNTAVCMFDPERRSWTLNQCMWTVRKQLLTVANSRQTNEAQQQNVCVSYSETTGSCCWSCTVAQ